jgi:hypothetical protein
MRIFVSKSLSENFGDAIEFTAKRPRTLILLTEHIKFCLLHQFMPFLFNLDRSGCRERASLGWLSGLRRVSWTLIDLIGRLSLLNAGDFITGFDDAFDDSEIETAFLARPAAQINNQPSNRKR